MPGPLSGIRVADFTWVWAGPTCTMQLAHMGAEVIRMETRNRICTIRMLPPWPGGAPHPDRSGYFNQYNQGKRAVTLNIASEEGREIAKKLVSISDVAVENFAGGVAKKLGLGYDDLVKVKPDIVMISMAGFGQTGPEAGYVSYGPAQVPMSGLSQLTGYIGWQPMHVGMSYGDPNAGLHAAFAVLSALYYRGRTGKGQYIDMSQWESSIAVIGEAIMHYEMNGEQPARQGSRSERMAPHGVFMVAGDDRWVSIAVANDDEWRTLAGLMNMPELADDPRFRTLADRKANEDELEELVMSWTLQFEDPYEIEKLLQANGIAAAVPQKNSEVMNDPHLAARDFWVEKPHADEAVGTRRHAGIPWKMSETPCGVTRAAPAMGQDNDWFFGELMGMSAEDIAGLTERGVIK
jgi:crotonobetainyl-CoA:carnitine CoA-transferase CaiB-like acyl-CoA transferase